MRGTRRLAASRGLAGVLLLAPAVVSYAAAPVLVTQLHRAFSVASVRLARGDTIRFSNADEFLHQIYVRSATFNAASPGQEAGETFDIRFPDPGVFEVRCEIHPKMLLTVTVE